MNVAILWDIAPRISYKSRCFGGNYHRLFQGRKPAKQETSLQQVARYNSYGSHPLHAGFLLGWFPTLKMEVIRSSKRRYIYELHDAILLNTSSFFIHPISDHNLILFKH
jgi:hypothetical protein